MHKQQLDDALQNLAENKKQWQLAYPEPAVFWPTFVGVAHVILDGAEGEDRLWVQQRIEELMEGYCLQEMPLYDDAAAAPATTRLQRDVYDSKLCR